MGPNEQQLEATRGVQLFRQIKACPVYDTVTYKEVD